jgi:hypothetical protein
MQYTIRNVPDTLDEALRRVARERGKSLNEVAIEALALLRSATDNAISPTSQVLSQGSRI